MNLEAKIKENNQPTPLSLNDKIDKLQYTKYSCYDSDLQRYIIQPVLINANAQSLIPEIYYTVLSGPIERQNGRLLLRSNGKIGFNNYVNSFYAAYWVKHTSITSASLSGVITGTGLLHLFRSAPGGKTIKIGTFPIGTGSERNVFHINFDLFKYWPSEGAGRYFFDIEAVTQLEIERMAFGTFTEPPQSPSLSIGICTYKKERYVSNIALTLESYMLQKPSLISDVFIVNNDSNLSELPILKLLMERNPNFHVFNQTNIGGAGGFARTLKESLDRSDSDHHIFMDDDIFIDPDVIERVWTFLAYARKDIVLGGQMMDMNHPNILYEGGAKLDYWGFLTKVGEKIDATSAFDVTFFDVVREVDYNAWWFACVPKRQASNIGLPLNIFIRGDDFEFGLRLKHKREVSTVSLPGIYVWHESFEGKNATWLEYYNWRNRFIICSLYAEPKTLAIQPVDMLRDILVDHLEAGRDEIAFVMCLAIIDFLAGPETVLARDAAALHQALRKTLAALKSQPGSAASILKNRIEAVGLTPASSPVIRLTLSPRLGGRKRSADEILWIERDIIPAIDGLLACYEAGVANAMANWKDRAHVLSSITHWEELYWPVPSDT